MVRKVGGTRKKAKTTTRKKSSRKGRVRGVGNLGGIAEKAGGLILGAVGGRELNALVVKMVPTLTPLMSGLMQIAVGFILPKFVKGPFFQNIGDGMIANGGMVTIVATGIITGPSDRMAYRINGTASLPVVNGPGRLPRVAGTGALPVVNGTGALPVVNGPANRIMSMPNMITPVVGGKFGHYV